MKKFIYIFSILLFACSTTSVEYRTATTSLRNDRDYNKAEEYAKKALDVDSNDALPAYFLAMEVYGSPSSPKKDYKKAADYFSKALEIDAIDGENQKLESSKNVPLSDGSYKELKTIDDAIKYYSYNLWAESFNEGISLIGQTLVPLGPTISIVAFTAINAGTESAAGDPLHKFPTNVHLPWICVEPIKSIASTTPGKEDLRS